MACACERGSSGPSFAALVARRVQLEGDARVVFPSTGEELSLRPPSYYEPQYSIHPGLLMRCLPNCVVA